MMRGGMERFLSDSTVSFRTGRWWEFAYGKSFVIRSIAYNVSHLDHNLMSESDVLIYKSKAMSQLTQVIETASLECHQRNIRFIVNFHPLNMEVHNAYMECTPIMDSLRSNHIETFDMLSYFIGHGINPTNAEDYYLPFDRHHNNKGYAIMAQGLSELF